MLYIYISNYKFLVRMKIRVYRIWSLKMKRLSSMQIGKSDLYYTNSRHKYFQKNLPENMFSAQMSVFNICRPIFQSSLNFSNAVFRIHFCT